VLITHPGRQPGFRRRNCGRGRYGVWWWLCLFSGRGDLLEAGPVAGGGLGGVLSQVVPQMPAVSHLNRARGAVAGVFGVGTARSRQITRTPGAP